MEKNGCNWVKNSYASMERVTFALLLLLFIFGSGRQAFSEDKAIERVDIINIWTRLNPREKVTFTAAVNPEVEGLSEQYDILTEYWEPDEGVAIDKRNGSEDPEPMCFLQPLFGESCRIKMEMVATPKWQ